MHEYMKNTTDTHRSLIELLPLARSGKGARYLSPSKAIELAKHAQENSSAITTAENFSYDPENDKELVGRYNFFWEQKLPQDETWTSFYNMLTERFVSLATKAKSSKYDEYFHVWIGMKGDGSDVKTQ